MLPAVLTLTGIALVAAAGLGVAFLKFAVTVDPRIERVAEILPGANCGACGYAGCHQAAEAIVTENALVDICAPGGQEAAQQIAEFLGKEVSEMVAALAVAQCGGSEDKAVRLADYNGISDCRSALVSGTAGKACLFSCVGLGTCQRACPFGAIAMGSDGLPIVDPDRCTGCGICVDSCPRDILALVPRAHRVVVACRNQDAGRLVRGVCKAGCIACKACEKVCPVEAIKVVDGLAVIDYRLCDDCLACVEKCPTKCIIVLGKKS